MSTNSDELSVMPNGEIVDPSTLDTAGRPLQRPPPVRTPMQELDLGSLLSRFVGNGNGQAGISNADVEYLRTEVQFWRGRALELEAFRTRALEQIAACGHRELLTRILRKK